MNWKFLCSNQTKLVPESIYPVNLVQFKVKLFTDLSLSYTVQFEVKMKIIYRFIISTHS